MRAHRTKSVIVQKSVKDNSLLFKSRPIIRFGCMCAVSTEVVFVVIPVLLLKYYHNLKKVLKAALLRKLSICLPVVSVICDSITVRNRIIFLKIQKIDTNYKICHISTIFKDRDFWFGPKKFIELCTVHFTILGVIKYISRHMTRHKLFF